MARRSDQILRLIATLKLVKGVVLVAVGVGAVSLLGQDAAHGLRGWLLDLQPANHYLRHAIARVCALPAHALQVASIALFLYAAVFVVEGVGLFLRRAWAEVMTTLITTSFLPLEIYELALHWSSIKAAVVVLNLAIAAYLVWRLRGEGHWPFRRVSAGATSSSSAA